MLCISICCFVLSIASLYAGCGKESPPVFEMMESPYAGMNYASLHELSEQWTAIKKDRKRDWGTAPITTLGMLSVSRDTLSNLLKACDVITPCALVCMASKGYTDVASIGAVVCGLCRTTCGKKCVEWCQLLSFEDTKQGRLLRIQLEEMQKAMDRCPPAEKAAFLRSRPDLMDRVEQQATRRSVKVSLSAQLSISVCNSEVQTSAALRRLPPPSPAVKEKTD